MATPTAPALSREGDATVMRRRSASITTERTHQLLIEQIIFQMEQRTEAGESLLQTSGKSTFRKTLEARPGACDSIVAEHIFLGITGYLFRSFRVRRGRLTVTMLRDYQVKTDEAIRSGMVEAQIALGLLRSRSIAGERSIVRVLRALDAKLERWFSEQHGQFAS